MGEPKSKTELAEFRRALLDWFKRHGRADLPWRDEPDPYAVTVSEFMLQQTTVAAVIPYYRRWLQRFPGFTELAAADEAEVLSAWEGLGYYSRARNLHKLARVVVEKHGGRMPREPEAIRALPGIGDYTAGAIAGFAFDQPAPALDANINRVFARLTDCREPAGSTAFRKTITAFAETILPPGDTGGRAFNSALMDLGATICLPRKPQCLICPVRKFCAAGEPEALPVKARKTIYEDREDHRLFFRDSRGRVLLRKSPGPTWRGLWLFPPAPPPEEQAFSPATPPLYRAKYAITKYRVTLRIYEAKNPPEADAECAWFDSKDLHALPMPAPYRKALPALLHKRD